MASGSRQTVITTGPDRRRMPSRRSAAKVRRSRTRPVDEFGTDGDATARTDVQVRPTAGGGPFGAATEGWPGPPGWTCDAESRVASLVCGCWVDTCASL